MQRLAAEPRFRREARDRSCLDPADHFVSLGVSEYGVCELDAALGGGASNKKSLRTKPGATIPSGLTDTLGSAVAPLMRKFAAKTPCPSPPTSISPSRGMRPNRLLTV